MKLIRSSVEIWDQEPTLTGAYKMVEKAGRVCYKSENKTTDNSYKKFIEMLRSNKHNSVLEHGTIYLTRKFNSFEEGNNWGLKYSQNPYSKVNSFIDDEAYIYVTTNLRVIYENKWEEDLEYVSYPIGFHHKRVTVHMICDRGTGNETTRHRALSFSQESTRYCNYSANKFNREVTFILPPWIREINSPSYENLPNETVIFLESLRKSQEDYFTLLKEGWKPEQARNILPLALKTEIVITGFISDWKNFFKLRTANNAHPQIRELATTLQNQFKNEHLF